MSRELAPDPWHGLRRFTAARIALGRSGASLPTRALLEFGAAQAGARDALATPFLAEPLRAQLQAQGWDVLAVQSAAVDREQYLRRPDLGRRLDAQSAALLDEACPAHSWDIVFVVGDGLSPLAAMAHAPPLLQILRERLAPLHMGPVVLAGAARVALADEIGERLAARQVVMLIGERPGLSAPDGMGIYLTHAPRRGRTDAERNCISNVRPQGLPYPAAALRLAGLIEGARRLGLSGVALKDQSPADWPALLPGPGT